jgi:hypothetical protein
MSYYFEFLHFIVNERNSQNLNICQPSGLPPPCFGRHVKPLVPALFAVVSIHQYALGPRGVGYGPFSLCVIHKGGLCPSSGDINRLMMMITVRCSKKLNLINVVHVQK